MKDNNYSVTLSNFSHEVRNPVTLIDSFFQLMVQEHPEIATYNYYGKIRENLDILRVLLDELTDFNHASKLHKENINIYYFLKSYLESVQKLLEPQGVRVELHKASAIPPIQLDVVRLNQLFNNIINNSREAILPNSGLITFTLSCDGSDIIIKICDTGCGIAAESLPNLFEPFMTTKKDGTGLGLAICKEIMFAHDGSISVMSVPDEGTEFELHFPIT